MNIFTFLRHYAHAKHGRIFKNRQRLERWQDQQVQALLKKILPRSPFYAKRFQGLPLSDWRQFPLMDKSVMMKHFDTLNTVGMQKEEALQVALKAEKSRDFSPTVGSVTVGLSSGTSGNRGLFLVSPEERYRWAGTMTGKVLPGSILVKHRIALFLRANSNLYKTAGGKRVQFEFYDLLDPLEEHIRRLNEYRPTILVAPPSVLRFLAQEKQREQLRILPGKIVSVAEVLDPLDEIFVAEQFNQKVHQIYQCTEGFLATTCAYGRLHLNEDLLVIQKEYIDRELRKFVPIITDFSRTSQPIIRYRLNDILTEAATPCPCGSLFTPLERIEGRCDDILYFPSQKKEKLVRVFADFITRTIISTSSLIEEYMVVQQAPDRLQISLKVNETEEEQHKVQGQVELALYQLLVKLGCREPVIHFKQQFKPVNDMKLRRVQRTFQVEEGV